MRAALALLLMLLAATFVAGCGGADAEALDDARERDQKQLEAAGESEGAGEETSEEEESAPDGETEVATEEPAGADEDASGQEAEADAEGAGGEVDLEQGRQLFAASCGACHQLADAGTTGTVGPPLNNTTLTKDQIAEQIANGGGGMPANLLEGEDAETVAGYIEAVAADK